MNTARDVCTFFLDGHLFGVDVVEVQEIIRPQRITRVPLAPPAVAGLLNVRGQLVTAIDLRTRLDLPPRPPETDPMNIVVRTADGAVSLLVDAVGDVVEIADDACEPTPPTLRAAARELIRDVVKLRDQLLIRLDTAAVIAIAPGTFSKPTQHQTI